MSCVVSIQKACALDELYVIFICFDSVPFCEVSFTILLSMYRYPDILRFERVHLSLLFTPTCLSESKF